MEIVYLILCFSNVFYRKCFGLSNTLLSAVRLGRIQNKPSDRWQLEKVRSCQHCIMIKILTATH